MGLRNELNAIFDAERALRDAEARLLGDDWRELEELLDRATDEALALSDRREAVLRLERLADLCAQVQGARMADALVRILGHDAMSVRVAAGEALLDWGYERYAEVARAIERALDRGVGAPAMAELPWLLAEIAEPSALPLLRRFVQHPEAEVVAAAIEAIARLGDPDALPDLERVADDDRTVTLDEDLGDETTTTTVGELARAASEELSGEDEG